MELWLILIAVGAILCAVGALLRIQHRMRNGEHFVPLEAEALDDVSHVPLASGSSLETAVDPLRAIDRSQPFRFRYILDGEQRLGHRGNPWQLPAVPHFLQAGRLRVYYSEQRDEAYLDCRTTLVVWWKPLLWGCLMLAGGAGLLALTAI